MAAAEQGTDLVHVVALLGAAVIAVPLFKRAGLGSVLGYLAAGLVIGPFGLRLFTDPQAILHVAELGVVMFLFVIGLEMQPSRLWSLRRDIFGLGIAQVATCGALLTGVGCRSPAFRPRWRSSPPWASCSPPPPSSCRSWRSAATPRPRRGSGWCRSCCSRISPSCRCSRWWRSWRHRRTKPPPAHAGLRSASRSPRSPALLAAGRWLLNPMFRVLANAQAREVMTAAALLVVLGAALVMQIERPVDGDGRVRRRCDAVGIELPASARDRHRAVPRRPARAVLPRRRHVARPRRDRPPLAADSRCRAGLHDREVRQASTSSRGYSGSATARRCFRAVLLGAGRRVRVRALCRGRRCRAVRRTTKPRF